MRVILFFLVASFWVGMAQAQSSKIYSVCENCVLDKAEAAYYWKNYDESDTFAQMSYSPSGVINSNQEQTIKLQLTKYECLQPVDCYPQLTLPAEIKIIAGKDPLKYNVPGALVTEVKVAGLNGKNGCRLGMTEDSDAEGRYSYKKGVNIYCMISLQNQRVMSLNLYFKRLAQ